MIFCFCNQWSFRLREELKDSESAHFLTLTYDDEHIIITGNNEPTLYKRDVQLFLKSLRKLQKQKIKYYFVGEYGGKTDRPHYHAIIFNLTKDTLVKIPRI